MTEISVPLDLITTPLFDKKHNISYSDSDFDGTAKWEMVVSDTCPINIADCLTSTGTLKSSIAVSAVADIKLILKETDDDGNIDYYNSSVSIAENMTMTLANDVNMKGMFLRKKSNGFVLMAMTNQTPMRFCDGVTFEKDNVLFIKSR